ncbi:hypothetical protein HHI36_017275 [Cryptolaemus montrouzieri]|uniref:Uncharacterized protein n=1 Tax=Cryptolaemus montrouzieri TaxID=559131 RepID=A0ABD2NMV3_9CUCU
MNDKYLFFQNKKQLYFVDEIEVISFFFHEFIAIEGKYDTMDGSDNDMEDDWEGINDSEVKDSSGGISEPEGNGVVQPKGDNPEEGHSEAPDRVINQLSDDDNIPIA